MSIERDYGKPEALAPVPVECPMDEFENAIRKIGVVNACEWFGHRSDSHFTAGTIVALRLHNAEALLKARKA